MSVVAAPTEYRITGHVRPEGSATVLTGTTAVDIDATWGAPPTGQPGPAELLASAFAACLLKNLARSRNLLEFRYDAAEVEVIARRQDSPPRFTEISYTLRVSTDETPHRVELLHKNLRKFGTVYNTLAAICDVHGTVEAISSHQPPTSMD